METQEVSEDTPSGGAESFGDLLASIRREAGYTQGALVDAVGRNRRVAGVVRGAVAQWEAGIRVPGPPQLLALTRVIQPSSDRLVALLAAAAIRDTRYRSLCALWDAASLDRDARAASWLAWASAFPTRPARGRAYLHIR